MRIYISGPITGQEDTAKERFEKAEKEVKKRYPKKALGVINPFASNARIFENFTEEPTHADYMATAMAMLSVCDSIYLMRGWVHSEGCQQEFTYAAEHGYKVIY